jgi:hypothetical protein
MKQNSIPSAGATADSSKNVEVSTSSHNSSKPNVSCCLSRAGRRNRTCEDLGIKNKGGMFDLFDNAIKEIYRITDDEYDYLCENLTDGEMSLFVAEKLTFGEKKQCLSIVENHLANYVASKGSS